MKKKVFNSWSVVLALAAAAVQSAVAVDWKDGRLTWRWDRQALRRAAHRDGAYLLRTNLTDRSSEALWRMYVQLTEVEAVFRALKSELAIRPIWHWVGPRVEAHVMVAFLGYCLWVCLKQKLKAAGPGLTPWQLLDQFKRIVQVEVWFKLKAGGAICLPRNMSVTLTLFPSSRNSRA